MELTAYVEAGLTSRVTAVVSASAGRLAAEPATGAARVNWGAANPELGVLASIGDMPGIGQVFCAAQVLVKLPVRSGGDPLFGFDQTDVDVRLRSVRPFSLAAGGWWQGDVAYRTRFGAPADELRADLTSGLRLTPRLGVIAQAFGTVALQNRVGAVLPSNPTISANYSSASVQGSLLLRLASTWELQPALRRELWGRAAGAGTELSLLVWHHF